VFRGNRVSGQVQLDVGLHFASDGPDEAIVCVVRPDAISLTGARAPAALSLDGEIADIIVLGSYATYKIMVGKQLVSVQSADRGIRRSLAVGNRVCLSWHIDQQTVLADE
jgi:hypothetical protein